MYVDAAYCYRPSSVVCRSVCYTSEPCKNDCTDRDAVWVEDSVGRRKHVLDGGPDPPMGRGNSEGGRSVICAKTAEPIEMPFGLWAAIGRRNHVLDGGPAVLRNVAMTTNFGTKIAITVTDFV